MDNQEIKTLFSRRNINCDMRAFIGDAVFVYGSVPHEWGIIISHLLSDSETIKLVDLFIDRLEEQETNRKGLYGQDAKSSSTV